MRSKEIILIILPFLFINRCFGAIDIPNNVTVLLLFVFLLIGITLPTMFYKSFRMIFGGLFISSISCVFLRGQSLFDTFQALNFYWGILFYYYLLRNKFSAVSVEISIIILAFVFDLLYIAQFHLLDYGYNFLNIQDWMNDNELEGARLRVMSSGLYSIGIFYGITTFTDKTNYKLLKVLLILLGIYVLFLAGYRQMLFSCGLTFVFYLWRIGYRPKIKHLVPLSLLCVILLFVYQLPEIQQKIIGMQERQNVATFDNKDYVRILQLDYYLFHYFLTPLEYITGSGLPYYRTAFGKYMENQLVWVDWGLLGQSWVLGILTVLGWISYSVKAIRIRVAPRFKFISLWYVYLLSASLTNAEFFRDGNFLVHALMLYLVEKVALVRYPKKSIL